MTSQDGVRTVVRRRGVNREQRIVLASLAGVTVLAWLSLTQLGTQMAGSGMGNGEMAGMAMDPVMPMPWTAAGVLLIFAMWAVMMIGMMLPTAIPMILLFHTVAARRGGWAAGAVALFVLAYGLVWCGFSAAATALQWQLERMALLTPDMAVTARWLGGAILLAAGLYQWLPVKQACLTRCRSPVTFILRHWRSGPAGAFRIGLDHGVYCLGCCWALMGLLFVFGVMNYLWIAALGALVLGEKLVPLGSWLGRLAGVAMIGRGALLLAGF